MFLMKLHWIVKRPRNLKNTADGSGQTLTRNATMNVAHAKKLTNTFLRLER